MKVSNILIQDERVKISDYAYKSIIPDEYCYITTLFLSPEQIKQEDYNLEPDIFALGVLTYFLITGLFPLHLEIQNGNVIDAIKQYLIAVLTHH